MSQITGIHNFTVYKNDSGYTVAKYLVDGKKVYVVGQSLPETVDTKITFYGEWQVNKYGKSFKCSSYEIVLPTSEKGIVSYLVSLKCGVGKSWAKRIYETFGDKTWEVLEKEPDKLLSINRFGKKRLNALRTKMYETQIIRSILALFPGVPEITIQKAQNIARKFGNSAVEIIRENPYRLNEVKGLGFNTVDKLAQKFNGELNNPLRIQGCFMYMLDDFEIMGHACVPQENIIKAVYNTLNQRYSKEVVTIKECENELSKLVKKGICYKEEYVDKNKENRLLVYKSDSYIAENKISRNILRIMQGEHIPLCGVEEAIAKFNSNSSFKLADCQNEAIKTSLMSPISIITGGPGTGKTTIINAILKIHKKLRYESNPLLLAPTGRAARRMSETTGHPASTIHSCICYHVDEETGKETANVSELDANLIIIDETSMMDQHIASLLFDAIPSKATVILVGDPDQLPSVGAGNVLQDLIHSNVIPVTKLEVVYRQEKDSPIQKNSVALKNGNTELNYCKGFCLIEHNKDIDILYETCKFYIACVRKFGIDNVTLLTPLREKTILSVTSFNKQLQHALNPPKGGDELTMTVRDVEFRKGDKIMQMKNTNNAKNGDVGYIKDILYAKDPHNELEFSVVCEVEFNDDGNVLLYNKDDMKNISLAYASTVHKSQGSEYQTVIVVMSMQHKRALRRNLIYTAITRATENVAIMGEKAALDFAIKNDSTDVRCTFLSQRINNLAHKIVRDSSKDDSATSEEEGKQYEQLAIA